MKKYTFIMFLFIVSASVITGQQFTKITDPNNPLSTVSQGGYPGTSWIDYNNDDLIDLFINPDRLFKNEGGGNFSENNDLKGRVQLLSQQVIGSGNSWADYDNDGYIDLFVASGKSFLFRNNGNETFAKIEEGQISDSVGNRGWTCAWADYDNDGYADLLITHPANFVPGAPLSNHLYHNDGPPDFTFSRVTANYEFNTVTAPYTVATWYDYDLDGDMDLFIGSGPASPTPARDYLYKNLLKETDSIGFERINDSPIGTDLQDGQVWNWIDIDNDSDLDAFLTNYRGASNRLYRNENGNFTLVSSPTDLINIQSLANTWGDFDNDSYIDLIITTETKNYFFRNNMGSTFLPMENAITVNGAERGAASCDYDNDGDLDVYIIGFPGGNGLFRNDNSNANRWIKFKLTGTESNRSAIGATIRVKANITGKPVWQIRQVTSQNSFNSMNSLVQHFGLGISTIIDSVVIDWPSGEKQVLIDLPANTLQSVTEPVSTGIDKDEKTGFRLNLRQNYPNPFNPSTIIEYSILSTEYVRLKIFDVLGNEIITLVNEEKTAGTYKVNFDANGLSGGVYFCRIEAGDFIESKKMILLR